MNRTRVLEYETDLSEGSVGKKIKKNKIMVKIEKIKLGFREFAKRTFSLRRERYRR